MSDTSNAFGFGKFVPGFDFLQSLAKGASSSIPQLPNLSNWVAPTINVEELEKRIEELKAVQFWLEQNSRALSATIQALEVQKMTLATLKGMNFSMGDVANAFKLKTADTVMGGVQKAAEAAGGAADAVASAAARMAARPPAEDEPQPESAPQAARAEQPKSRSSKAAAAETPVVDPMQWWGALTSQFQQIAATAMKDAAKQTAIDTTKNMASGLAKEAIKTATGMASQLATQGMQTMRGGASAKKRAPSASAPAPGPKTAAAKKAPARKTAAAKKTTAPSASRKTSR
jgi:hypothetical protein